MSQIIQGKSGDLVAQVALRVPVDVRDWFRGHAASAGQSMNTAMNVALREKMQRLTQEVTAQN
mgnify:CR=1 FL=1